ncbi:MAG: M15 family metallopeptidase [Myxococcota bacterium]
MTAVLCVGMPHMGAGFCMTNLASAAEGHPGVRPVDASVQPAFAPDEDPHFPGLVDVGAKLPTAVVDLKYRSTDNFMKRNVYGGLRRCFLVEQAALMLERAQRLLEQRAPHLTFVLWDCARPRRVQKIMWEAVKGTPSQHYVANPYTRTGSIHNYGCAVDLGLYDRQQGTVVDMGTPYDYFGRLAEPRHEISFWKEGTLSSEQWSNRLLLREVMLRSGFLMIPNEWWHFNCAPNDVVRRTYSVIE